MRKKENKEEEGPGPGSFPLPFIVPQIEPHRHLSSFVTNQDLHQPTISPTDSEEISRRSFSNHHYQFLSLPSLPLAKLPTESQRPPLLPPSPFFLLPPKPLPLSSTDIIHNCHPLATTDLHQYRCTKNPHLCRASAAACRPPFNLPSADAPSLRAIFANTHTTNMTSLLVLT